MSGKRRIELLKKEIDDGTIWLKEKNSYPFIDVAAKIETILDGGAHIGTTASYFAGNYPDANIYCYEPDPTNFEKLVSFTKNNENIYTFNYGLSDTTKEVTFFQCSDIDLSFWGTTKEEVILSSHYEDVKNYTNDIKVKVCNAYDVMLKENLSYYDLIKLDTEGAEVEILSALQPTLHNTSLIYLEYHSVEDKATLYNLLMDTHKLYHHQPKPDYCGICIWVNKMI